jgi:hypothetical protein
MFWWRRFGVCLPFLGREKKRKNGEKRKQKKGKQQKGERKGKEKRVRNGKLGKTDQQVENKRGILRDKQKI